MTTLEADSIRSFWALFLGSKIGSDGSIPGFDRWWKQAHPDLAKLGQRMAGAAANQIERGAPMDDCVASAVSGFKRAVQAFRPPRQSESPPAWSQFCGEVFERVMDHGWKPPQVLQALYGAEQRFVSLECPIREWIEELEAMGTEWREVSRETASV